ncbi:hypothetical protein BEN78_01925 [Xanthomonas citri pv. mangiferaeindicae]|nr:hypothetical protein BEN78_01925 [Xanthomonas citri pv. mangiferaeindicae]
MSRGLGSWKRTLAAAAIAPVWTAAFAIAYVRVSFPITDAILSELSRGQRLALGAAIGLSLGYVAMLLIGLPVHAALRRLERSTLSSYVVAWSVMALVLWAVIHIAGFLGYGWDYAIAYLFQTLVERPVVPLSLGLCWVLVAASFWAVARPDRSARAPSSRD